MLRCEDVQKLIKRLHQILRLWLMGHSDSFGGYGPSGADVAEVQALATTLYVTLKH